MSDQITYDDKADLIVDTTIDDMFKVSASDMNEIKNVVNANAQEMDLNKAEVQDDIAVINNNITDLNNNKLDINEVLNQASNDTDKPYSADYLNDKLVSVGTTAPTDGERVWFKKSSNLLPQNKYISSTTINGITFTNNGDGTFNLSGTATANTTIIIIPANIINLEANQPYYLYSSIPYDLNTFNLSIAMTDNSATKFITANNTYTPASEPTNEKLQFYIGNGKSLDKTNVKLMLVKGNQAPTQYEPFLEQQGIYVDNELYGDNYSYNEQVIGKWVDGKKIYRKVVTFNINTSAMTTQYTHNIANIENIMPSCKAIVKRGAVDVYVVPFVYPNSSSDMVNYGIGMNITSTKVTLYIGSSMRSAISSYPAIVVLEYTKSTD